jgi:2-polyprenyl-3-methyl-5-hydroxy-6-metoxy-1,4-benzoquinol methylase
MSSACNLCDGTDFEVLETATDGIRVVQCARCRLIFLDPFPNFDSTAHYNADYYRPWLEEQRCKRLALWAKRVELLERFAPIGQLLDVGCGDGSFLLAARGRGWRVVGTEVSQWAAHTIRDTPGLAILKGDLLQIDHLEMSFDVVTMWHVLEHMHRPLQTLVRARKLLTDKGIIIVAVPNAGFTLFRVAYPVARLRRLRYYTPGERELHLHHFTPDTLRAMLEKAGFRLLFEGIDENALRPANLLLEMTAKAVRRLTGACWSEAMLVVASKAGT